MADIEILPELRDCLPGQTVEELALLRKGLERDGMRQGIELCTITGYPGRYILDGHTRYRLALETGIAWKLGDDVFHFDSVDDAIVWIIENNAGRRTLTPQQTRELIARHYKASKKPVGSNRFTDEKGCKIYTPTKTAAKTAAEFGISPRKVHLAVVESEKIESLGLTDAVMDGTVKKIESAALDELAEAVEHEPERKEELVDKFIDKAKQNNGRAKAQKPKTTIAEEQHDEDPEMDLILGETVEIISGLIYRARSEWTPTYMIRLKKSVLNAFDCKLPAEWRD